MIKQYFTDKQDAVLMSLRSKGLSYLEIGEIMERSVDSLRCRMWDLNKKEKFSYEEKKILVFDLETSLMDFRSFHTGEQYLTDSNIVNDYILISWSAKWLGEPEVMGDILTPREAKNRNDKRICKSIRELIDQSDIILGHNIDKFDSRKVNTRLLVNRIPLPSPVKSVDTLKIARSKFYFSSNRLDYLARFLGVGEKMEHEGMQLWIDCLTGRKPSLDKMLAYNKQDVIITERVYNILKEGFAGVKKPKDGWKNE